VRKDGLYLSIAITPALVPDEGKPTTIAMVASEASSVTRTLGNDGGSIRFSGLVPDTGPDVSGEAMDLAGTIEWTCGDVLQTSDGTDAVEPGSGLVGADQGIAWEMAAFTVGHPGRPSRSMRRSRAAGTLNLGQAGSHGDLDEGALENAPMPDPRPE